jgi:DNA-binding LacI/PurR family transcriptional regulator
MATIHDVARAAGVSISTVSYALSGKRSIAESTRTRVMRAATELDYQPHAAARMLAGTRAQILALSAPFRADGHMPTHMRFVTAVVEAARRHDYDVLLLATDDEISGLRRVASSSLVDAAVVLGVSTVDERVPLVRRLGLPSTFIGVPRDADDVMCIDLDFESAGRMTVERLAAAGHRTIGVVGHPHGYVDRDTNFIRRFADGFDAACAEFGIRTARVWPELGKASAHEAFDELYADLDGMTALVFHCNEPIAEAVLARIAERGISIPDDLSVLAACASYATDELSPPLDTIPLPLEEMCARAVESAIDGVSEPVVAGIDLIAPTYVGRGSVVAPAAAPATEAASVST